jgi:branched-chain amino acid aminotransferase
MMGSTNGAGNGIVYIDGDYCLRSEAKISIFDLGFLLSDCTYDALHVRKGKFFRMDEHLERFERSMAGLRLEIPYDRAAVTGIIHECVRRSGLRESMVMVLATRGMVPPDGRRDLRKCTNGFIASALPYHAVATPEELEKGIDMIVSSVTRIPTESVDPRIKNFNRLDFCRALFEAYDSGANYAVLPDQDGNLTEGLGYNVFASRGGRLISPDWGVFEGITRRTIFEMCAETNVKAELVKMKAADLHEADEVFIASTAGGIMPVSTVDGTPIGNGMPGPLTTRLTKMYWDWHEKPEYLTTVDYD